MNESVTPAIPEKDLLTPKQRRFVEQYLVDLNGAAAARRAGYSEKTAREIATKLKRNPLVAQAIADEFASRSITKTFIVDELAKIANGEIENTLVHDRLSALDKLGRIIAIYKDASGPVNATQVVINLPPGAEGVLYGGAKIVEAE